MSTRTHIVGLTSLEKLRDVVGSKDKKLAARLTKLAQEEIADDYGDLDDLDEDDREEVQEALDESTADIKNLINGTPEDDLEPGAWVFLLKKIIEELELELPIMLPINKGYKHHYAWGPYRKLVSKSVTPASLTSLAHIENGRPMKGQGIDHDGSQFAWLTTAEVAELYQSLSKVTETTITNEDLHEFHDDLVQSLKMLSDKQAPAFVIAH